MPGNKNSGRKKRAVIEEIAVAAPLSKKKVGRPKKENVHAEVCDETTIYNEVIVVDVSNEMADSDSDARKAEHSPLQLWDLRKRTSDISIFLRYISWHYIGPFSFVKIATSACCTTSVSFITNS